LIKNIYIYILAPESHRRLSHRLVFFVEYILRGQNIRRKEKKTCAHEPPYYGLQSQKSKFKISQDFCLPHVHLSPDFSQQVKPITSRVNVFFSNFLPSSMISSERFSLFLMFSWVYYHHVKIRFKVKFSPVCLWKFLN